MTGRAFWYCFHTMDTFINPMLMYPSFTDSDLIRFLYHETTAEETRTIKEHLQYDEVLSGRLHDFRIVQQALGRKHYRPSDTSVQIIMAYSRKVSEELSAPC